MARINAFGAWLFTDPYAPNAMAPFTGETGL